MKAVVISEAGLREKEIPRPSPAAGEVLIRVAAAGVTPTELAWHPTSHTKGGERRQDAVPAHEFSGTVEEVGEGVAGVSVGEAVFGMNDWFADGALAEFCVTRSEWIAPKPHRLSHQEAGSVPIGALTAWQGLFDRARLQAGERVLIHGGAGAVGLFAVQLAARRGAHVTTTVSERNARFVRELGAEQVIDYRTSRFDSLGQEFAVVFDGVGGDTLDRSWSVLKPDGRMVTIASNSETAQEERVKQAFFIVEPRREQLVEIARLLDAGELRCFVDGVAPLSAAADAYTGRLERKGRGKTVVAIAD